MTRNEQLINWLGNRQRKYADGVALFDALAKQVQKEKYSAYFAAAPANPHIFDPHFTQLINCLTRISREIREAPELYPAANESIVEAKEVDEKARTEELTKRTAAIATHEQQIEELTERIEYLEGSDNTGDISELQEQIDEHRAELEQLRKEVDALSEPGVKVVTEASMPTSIKKAYARIKEIAPLYASLHNDIANPDLEDEKRKSLAEELCKLDDERRKLWKAIDAWAEGKGTLSLDAKRPVFSNNPVVRGIELARHVKRLKQNIVNSQRSADKAKEDGRQVVYDNAMSRIAGYEEELAEIEKEIAGEKVSG
uniref:Vacuolar sorting 38 and autophagy-related subunit 14 n=1 Tax=Siphoviridae sp. ctrWS2 TaxID=2823602 RepID=A0A8S5LDS7_9CAUD|nr:MAG TPA: vacuolar sorting 38 and autophagy-related subunit 14 [Siphoviridae sp. ctrWS2]